VFLCNASLSIRIFTGYLSGTALDSHSGADKNDGQGINNNDFGFRGFPQPLEGDAITRVQIPLSSLASHHS